jgi:hypothetical protein
VGTWVGGLEAVVKAAVVTAVVAKAAVRVAPAKAVVWGVEWGVAKERSAEAMVAVAPEAEAEGCTARQPPPPVGQGSPPA